MRPQIDVLIGRARGPLRRAGRVLRAHRWWMECAAITLATTAAMLALGRSAQARTSLLEREAAQLQEVGSGIDRWAERLQPPTPAESLAWRESERLLHTMMGPGREPLAVARRLAHRAEAMGIHDLKIQLASPEGSQPPPPVETERWTVGVGPTPVIVEFTGDWPAVLALTAALPPEVELGRVQVATDRGQLRSRMLLFIREATVRS